MTPDLQEQGLFPAECDQYDGLYQFTAGRRNHVEDVDYGGTGLQFL